MGNRRFAPHASSIVALTLGLVSLGSLSAQTIPVGGEIVDSDGKPLAAIEVRLEETPTEHQRLRRILDGSPVEAVAIARTDSAGRFMVEAPRAGMWTLHANGQGRAAVELPLRPLLERRELRPIELARAAIVKVRVESAGKPVTGALVVLRTERERVFRLDQDREPATPRSQTARTNEAGEAELSTAERARYTLAASAPAFVVATQEAQRGPTATVELAVGVLRQVVVVDDRGRPHPEAVVLAGVLPRAAGLPVAITDPEGRATVAVPKDKEELVRVLAANGAVGLTGLAGAASAPDGEAPEPVRIAATLGALRGRVVATPDRSPVAGAMVWDAADPARFVVTGKDGAYELRAAPRSAQGMMAIGAEAPSHFQGNAPISADEVALAKGPTLALEPSTFVRGRVVDATGAAVAGARVGATPSDFRRFGGFASGRASSRSDDQGRFELAPLALDQAYSVEARRRGFARKRVELGAARSRPAGAELTIELRASSTAFGHVVDSADVPIPGAEVTLQPSLVGNALEDMLRRQTGAADSPHAVSDDQGRFEIADLEAGRYDLRASADGFAPATISGLTVPETATDGAFELGTVALSPGATIEGIVSDGGGNPITGAEVHARQEGGGIVRVALPRGERDQPTATSDDLGRFTVSSLAAGEPVSLEVRREGYASTSLSGIRPPTTEPLAITLEAASTLRGSVVDELGSAIPGASLRLVRQAGSSDATTVQTVTGMMRNDNAGEDGRFEVKGIAAGRWDLSASGRGFQEVTRAGIEVVAGRDPEELRIVLPKGAVLTGQVLGLDRAPVVGATVRSIVQRFASFQSGGQMLTARTDGDGRYRIEGLATGRVSMTAEHPKYQAQVLDIEVRPEENTLDFELDRGLEITGRVIDENQLPVEGARVQATAPRGGSFVIAFGGGRGRVVTGPDGAFVLEGLATGSYQVGAQKTGYAAAQTDHPVVLDSSSQLGIELRLERGAAIIGHVLGLELDELSRVQVMASQSGGVVSSVFGPVSFEGNYRLEHLRPGDWMVTAQLGRSGKRVRKDITLDPGTVESTLDLEFGGGLRLSGQVLRGERPAIGVNVFAIGETTTSSAQSSSDQEGRFTFEGLERDAYRVGVRVIGGAAHEQKVELDSDLEITIALSESRLSGRVLDDETDGPIAGAELTLAPLEEDTVRFFAGFGTPPRSGSQGEFSFGGVAPGRYQVRASHGGFATATAEVEVSEGEDLSAVELRMSPAGGLTLFILHATGNPARQVTLAAVDRDDRVVLQGFYTTGEGGRLRLADLPSGDWILLISSAGGAATNVPVRSPGPPQTVTLPPSGTIRLTVTPLVESTLQSRVRVFDQAGNVYRAPGFQSVQTRFGISGGRALLPLPVGVWRLEVTTVDGAQSWSTTTSVVPGVVLDVVIE